MRQIQNYNHGREPCEADSVALRFLDPCNETRFVSRKQVPCHLHPDLNFLDLFVGESLAANDAEA